MAVPVLDLEGVGGGGEAVELEFEADDLARLAPADGPGLAALVQGGVAEGGGIKLRRQDGGRGGGLGQSHGAGEQGCGYECKAERTGH